MLLVHGILNSVKHIYKSNLSTKTFLISYNDAPPFNSAAVTVFREIQEGPCCTVFRTDILELWMNISWPDGLGSSLKCCWQWIPFIRSHPCLDPPPPLETSMLSDLRFCRCFLKRNTKKSKQGEAE